MRTKADDLLEGAIDVHAHIFPQVFVEEPGRVLDHEWAELARDVGMRGFVMKSHLWPTIAQARILNEVYPGVTAFGAITLNANVGGLSPFAAESAARLGVKVIWMPTYSAANDIKVGAYSKRIAEAYKQPPPAQGLMVMDGDGAISPRGGRHTRNRPRRGRGRGHGASLRRGGRPRPGEAREGDRGQEIHLHAPDHLHHRRERGLQTAPRRWRTWATSSSSPGYPHSPCGATSTR